jgi:hypothetical protein
VCVGNSQELLVQTALAAAVLPVVQVTDVELVPTSDHRRLIVVADVDVPVVHP